MFFHFKYYGRKADHSFRMRQSIVNGLSHEPRYSPAQRVGDPGRICEFLLNCSFLRLTFSGSLRLLVVSTLHLVLPTPKLVPELSFSPNSIPVEGEHGSVAKKGGFQTKLNN